MLDSETESPVTGWKDNSFSKYIPMTSPLDRIESGVSLESTKVIFSTVSRSRTDIRVVNPKWILPSSNRRKVGMPPPCPVCKAKGCNIKSHRRYTEYVFQRQAASKALYKRDTLPGFNPGSPPSNMGNLDPFIKLPIQTTNPEALRLFRGFFTSQCSALDQVPRVLGFDFAYTPKLVQLAYADEVTCQSCIAMAATFAAVHAQNLEKPDKALSAIYENAIRVLRARLALEVDRPSTSTVMAAVNLIMAQAIGMSDKSALSTHRAGIKTFVDAWGGIHNLEPQLMSLITWTDYWATLFTGIQPMYIDSLSSDIRLDQAPAAIYGLAFEEPRMLHIADKMLLENCVVTARLIELVEDRVNNTSTPSRWQYFLYKRDWIATRNAIVHSKLFEQGNKAECIGITMNLMLLLVLRMVPWKSPANELCSQMKLALISSGAASTYWSRDADILLYILFVVLAAADHWIDRPWALGLLQKSLQAKHGQTHDRWAPNWREQELFNLRRFSWSEVFLTESFHKTCREIEMLFDGDHRGSNHTQIDP